MRFDTIECEKGDLVRVASISMEVVPNIFKVIKKGRNTVFLIPFPNPLNEGAKPWNKTRVIEVVKEVEAPAEAPKPVENAPKRKRGRPPKVRPPETIFDLDSYLSSFSVHSELWMRKGKNSSSNILIDGNREYFWYFRTGQDDRPLKKFYGPIPKMGRRFKLMDYDAKVAVLKAKRYVMRAVKVEKPS